MRKYGYLAYDLLGICLMLVVALYLRNGLQLIEEGRPDDLNILFGSTIVCCLLVLPGMRIHLRMWRYTSPDDLWSVVLAITLIVLLSYAGLFMFNRLEIVPRSVPPMHWALCIIWMGGSRLIARRLLGPSRRKYDQNAALRQHVLVVGTGHTAELYLDFARKMLAGQVSVEGVIDENPALIQRSFHQYPIIGTPQDLPQILEQFHVHGILISQLVLAQPIESLSMKSRQALFELQRQEQVELFHFEKLFYHKPAASAVIDSALPAHSATYETLHGFYPPLKRGIDIIGAISLMLLCLPLFVLAALLVWLDVGLPLLFWQQRPGRYGRPFRLYKFRTMRPAGRRRGEDRLAHKSGDARRTSIVGQWMRRLRLDELPQLFHILSGTMSFIGPRPLLPDDQPANGQLRLSVRPGITGWAQVNGGDALTADEKLVLDIWYIRNMSLWLDIRIVLQTLVVLFQKDRARPEVIREARERLGMPQAQHSAKHHAA